MVNDLAQYISMYDEYIINRLKLIQDFDIWFEQTTGQEFPKEWYHLIRTSRDEEDK